MMWLAFVMPAPLHGAIFSELLSGSQKKMTWVLYHCGDRPINMVCHSQGCLHMNNALFTMGAFKRADQMRENVALISTGSPVNDGEMTVRANMTTILRDPRDGVSKYVGMKLSDVFKAVPYEVGDHPFQEFYVHRIRPKMLWAEDPKAASEQIDDRRNKGKNIGEYGIYQSTYYLTSLVSFSPALASFVASVVTSVIAFPFSLGAMFEADDEFNEYKDLRQAVRSGMISKMKELTDKDLLNPQVSRACQSVQASENSKQAFAEWEEALEANRNSLALRKDAAKRLADERIDILASIVKYYDENYLRLEILAAKLDEMPKAGLDQRAEAWIERDRQSAQLLRDSIRASRALQKNANAQSQLETEFALEAAHREAQSVVEYAPAIEVAPFKGLETSQSHRLLKILDQEKSK